MTDAPRTRAEHFAMYLRYRKADEIMGWQVAAKVQVVNTTCENGAVASKTHTICCSLRLDLISSTSVAHVFKAQRIAVFDGFSKEFDFCGIAAMSCSL